MLSSTDIMNQASMTACEYMIKAKKDIDNLFGEGFAKKNPSLVGDYMKVAAQDFSDSLKYNAGIDNISNR